jgi:eukaryotic-like serine/threonine-protein kinase
VLFRGQTLGKYKIVAPLGSGGFGTVYLAQDTWIDKKVAIKVPHRQGLDFGELLREPRLLASVSHPNIVAITTAEKQDNVFFIVMEYVPGETLENIIGAQGALELNRALDYTCQICNAVDHAHQQGVIHRDLRPANVLVGEHDMLKVADFGTSRFLEIAAHGTTVIGSPPYMAPEQFHGKAVFASDIYSLGVTMYQMLTGELPYDTPAPADLDKLMSGELVSPPRLKNPSIPKAINDIVMKRDGARHQRALPAGVGRAATTSWPRARAGRRRRAASSARTRARRARTRRGSRAGSGARGARGALLLAVPQAAARAVGSLPVLQRAASSAVPDAARPKRRPTRPPAPWRLSRVLTISLWRAPGRREPGGEPRRPPLPVPSLQKEQ